MLKKIIVWISWTLVVLTIFFFLFALSTALNWFDREIANMLTVGTFYIAFVLGVVLLGCFVFEPEEEETASSE